MASKAHADVHTDEMATADGRTAKLEIFRETPKAARRSSTRYRSSRGWSSSTRSLRAGAPGRRPGGALELQGRPLRVVQRGDQRPPQADVQDKSGGIRGSGDTGRPHEGLPGHKGPCLRRLLELRGLRGITPFTTSQQAPFTMYEEDVERLYEPKKCIECFMCQDVCHVLRTHHKHAEFAARASSSGTSGSRCTRWTRRTV